MDRYVQVKWRFDLDSVFLLIIKTEDLSE